MGAKPFKGVLEQIMPYYYKPYKNLNKKKNELDTLELLFNTHFVCESSKKLQNWDRLIPYFRFKCVRKMLFCAYGSYAPDTSKLYLFQKTSETHISYKSTTVNVRQFPTFFFFCSRTKVLVI